MAKVDIWMPIYIGDYLSDTMSLSAAEHGCYLLLMMHYWKQGELISDKRKLLKIACLEPGQEYILESVLQEYFRYEDGFYIQNRIEKELINAMSRREAARQNGKKGGRPRKENPEKTDSFSEGKPRKKLKGNPEKSSSPSPSPSSLSTKTTEEIQPETNIISLPSLSAAQPEKKQLSKMKDPLSNHYQNLFVEIYPDSGWGDFGKERKQLDIIAGKTKTLFNENVPFENEYQFSEAIIKKFLTMKQSGFWKAKDKPVTPSSLSACWAEVIDGLIKDHVQSQPFEEVAIF